jgi:hypothetical protein
MLNASEARSMMPEPHTDHRKLLAKLCPKVEAAIAKAATSGDYHIVLKRNNDLTGREAVPQVLYEAVMRDIEEALRKNCFHVESSSDYNTVAINWQERGG